MAKKTVKRKIVRRHQNINARSAPYEPRLLENLKDLNFAAEFLTHCFDADGDIDEEFEVFFSALAKIVKAHGIEDVAEKMSMRRDTIYKMFKHQNPTAKTLKKLLKALGLEFSFRPIQGYVPKKIAL